MYCLQACAFPERNGGCCYLFKQLSGQICAESGAESEIFLRALSICHCHYNYLLSVTALEPSPGILLLVLSGFWDVFISSQSVSFSLCSREPSERERKDECRWVQQSSRDEWLCPCLVWSPGCWNCIVFPSIFRPKPIPRVVSTQLWSHEAETVKKIFTGDWALQ